MSRTFLAAACVAAFSATALAQGPTRPGAPDPLDPQAAVPPARHVPALSGYRPLSEAPVGSWKDANERVNRIGGWRAYARESAQPASAPASAPASSPAAAGHRH